MSVLHRPAGVDKGVDLAEKQLNRVLCVETPRPTARFWGCGFRITGCLLALDDQLPKARSQGPPVQPRTVAEGCLQNCFGAQLSASCRYGNGIRTWADVIRKQPLMNMEIMELSSAFAWETDSLEPISAIDVQPAFGRSPFISFIVDLSDNQLTQRHIYIDGTTVCKRDLIADNAKIHLQATPLIILTS